MEDGSAFGSDDRVVKKSRARPLLTLALEGAALVAEPRPSVFGFGRKRLRLLGWQAETN
jgi:hypothetical protein